MWSQIELQKKGGLVGGVLPTVCSYDVLAFGWQSSPPFIAWGHSQLSFAIATSVCNVVTCSCISEACVHISGTLLLCDVAASDWRDTSATIFCKVETLQSTCSTHSWTVLKWLVWCDTLPDMASTIVFSLENSITMVEFYWCNCWIPTWICASRSCLLSNVETTFNFTHRTLRKLFSFTHLGFSSSFPSDSVFAMICVLASNLATWASTRERSFDSFSNAVLHVPQCGNDGIARGRCM